MYKEFGTSTGKKKKETVLFNDTVAVGRSTVVLRVADWIPSQNKYLITKKKKQNYVQ